MPNAADELQELLRRGEDFEVFVEEILGIRLNKAQKRIARIMRRVDPRKRQWAFKLLVVVAANQIGKTLIQACIILWGCIYKFGTPDGDKQAWLDQQYIWIHLGPVQQQAYHAYKDMRLIIRGAHPAQGGRNRLPPGLVTPTKIENYYDGFEFFNGAVAMFRTAEDKGEAVLGYRAAAISVDEAAFVRGLTSEVNEVLMMRLIASGGPLLLFSTPNGMNDFFDFADAIKSAGVEVEDMVWTNGGDFLVWAIITDNLGYGIDAAEIDRMERTLNPATKEQQLRGAFLEPQEAFFVPQDKILEAFRHDLPDEQLPVPGHQYAIFWDPSLASDPTAVIVLDVTSDPWTGVYNRHYERPLDVTKLVGAISQLHSAYHLHQDANPFSVKSFAVTGFDATSMGGAAVRGLLAQIHPKRPVNFGGNATKVPSLTNLRDLLTSGKIIIPASWTRVRQEILNYRLKDENLKQDNVMALMGASIVAHNMTVGRQQQPFNVGARITSKKSLKWG